MIIYIRVKISVKSFKYSPKSKFFCYMKYLYTFDDLIQISCQQVPLYVATNMALNVASCKRATLFIPTAEDYVSAAARRIGYEARCTPFWAHSLQWCIASFAPKAWLDAWRLSIGIRRRSAK